MENTDLRIGNYLQRVDGSIFSVKRLIKDDDDILVNETQGLFTLGYTALPIPLTEEILLKCGFYVYDDKYKYFAHKEVPGIFHLFDDVAEYSIDSNDVCWVNGLHQLQNIFHSLTGQELKIEL